MFEQALEPVPSLRGNDPGMPSVLSGLDSKIRHHGHRKEAMSGLQAVFASARPPRDFRGPFSLNVCEAAHQAAQAISCTIGNKYATAGIPSAMGFEP